MSEQVMDVRALVREVVQEFSQSERERTEPAYKTELTDERKRREQLERQVNELIEENRRSRSVAEQTERYASIKSELQKLGVSKIDLAFKAVRDDIFRSEDGRLLANNGEEQVEARQYLTEFVAQNPELLPARIPGGSGASSVSRQSGQASIDLDRIKPGMSTEDMDRVRQEIARLASQAMNGL